MGIDITTFLTTISLATSGNVLTGAFSIGGEDDRTYSASGLGSKAAGRQWGLDAHSRIEADASATRADFFLNNGSVPSNLDLNRVSLDISAVVIITRVLAPDLPVSLNSLLHMAVNSQWRLQTSCMGKTSGYLWPTTLAYSRAVIPSSPLSGQ